MRTLGVDLSANPRKTAACVVDWEAGTVTVPSLPGTVEEQDGAIVERVLAADVAAFDVPLGWPDAFVEAVSAHHKGPGWPSPSPDNDRLRYRTTDRAVRNLPNGHWPLSVSTDKLGATALRGARLQDLLARRGAPVDRSGTTGKVVEAYPAAALRAWGVDPAQKLPAEGLAGELAARCGPLAAEVAEKLDGCTRDVVDAFVCALVARAARLGLTEAPPEEEMATARREGWIHVPTCRVEDLVAAAD